MTSLLLWESLLVFVLNIPFGYWRINVGKFSLQWVLAIHIPVIIVIALRFLTPIGFAFNTYLFLIGSFFLGQKTGSLLNNYFAKIGKETTSCLVMDVWRFNQT
jgi:hypothetical protein